MAICIFSNPSPSPGKGDVRSILCVACCRTDSRITQITLVLRTISGNC